MALPNVPYAAQTNPTMSELDQTFAAVGALGVVPCTASGTNTITLTPNANTPTISAYANYLRFSFIAAATSSGSVQMLISGLATLNLYVAGGTTQATTGDIVSGQYYDVAYSSTLNSNAGGFVIVSAIIPASSGVFTKSYSSGQKTFTLGSQTSLSHSMGAQPTLIQLSLQCLSGEGGYSIGDEVNDIASWYNDGTNTRGFAIIVPGAASILVTVGTTAIIGMNKGTGAPFTLTPASWAFVVRAWA